MLGFRVQALGLGLSSGGFSVLGSWSLGVSLDMSLKKKVDV